MRKRTALLLSLLLTFSLLSACGTGAPATVEEPAEPAEEENYGTGDASLDDPRNADGIGETELLVVSFGTSYNDNRRLTIGAIEQAMADAFPGLDVRRGFTSQIIIDHVYGRDGEKIDNVAEALDRAAANGVKRLIVQPTHLMSGFEYNDVVNEVAQYADAFERVAVGRPILDSDEDFRAVAEAIVDATAQYDDGKTAIVFMGHGTEAGSNGVYEQMQAVLDGMGRENYYIGTVEAAPGLDDVIDALNAKAGTGISYQRVILRPLMIVAGDHANNDMAGDDPDSWKTALVEAGYDVICVLEGLGGLPAIQELLVQHAQAAIDSLETKAPSNVASAEDMTAVEEVVEPGMVPVSADSLKDGMYLVDMKSSSSMFKAERCELTVKNGEMYVTLFMSSTSYSHMYAGTAEQAAADKGGWIPLTDGVFTLPLEALDAGTPFAAFSVRKELWYDRTLLFRADSLPPEAFAEGYFTTAESLGLSDGEYTVEVSLSGGSGRASVASPAKLTVTDGGGTAVLVWNSSNYDYMKVDGTRYDPVMFEPGSTFEIPVPYFDRAVTICADTTAMSQPYEIEYALTFDSASIRAVDGKE